MQVNGVKRKAYGPDIAAGDEETIREWLVDRIATGMELPRDAVDMAQPFSYYGLDSVAAVGMSAELEDWLGRKLSPTLTWDYPTIELLSRFLWETLQPAQSQGR